MNPRIQVEHTVTEEVTDVDLVQSQMRIASGETLADLGLSQDGIVLRGAALQCRITTEDPANNFRPDTGRITTYRSPGGAGIRLDGGTTYTGAEISPHFDSMLAKLTCRGRTLREGRRAGAAGAGGVPDPRRLHQHRVPPGAARRPRLPGRPRDDVVHRDAPRPADRPLVRRPRHQAPHVPRRRHRQPAARPRAGQPRPGQQAARRRPVGAGARRHPSGSCWRSARRSSPAGCARRTRSPSPTPRSATPTSRCWPPGCVPATCSPSPATSPG